MKPERKRKAIVLGFAFSAAKFSIPLHLQPTRPVRMRWRAWEKLRAGGVRPD